MRPLRPGDPAEIGGYRLRAHLGRGGMGSVYLASTPGGRLVAVKSIRAELVEDSEFRERFRLEVRAARRVRGLYTAELLDADPDANPPWLVTSYIPGPSVAGAVKAQGPVPPRLVPLLMAGVAEALLDIHSGGIVHRDLKPSNVLLSPDGPRVIDFGIAWALDSAKLTQSGVTMGSPECMTPEQVRGVPVTPAADVFALGSLAAYALRGRSPFNAPNSAAMMFRVAHETPDLDGFPQELRAMLEHCLAKDPGDRPSPMEVLDFCRTRIPDEPAVFPRSWQPYMDGGPPDPVRTEWLDATGDVQPALLSADGELTSSRNDVHSSADRWATSAPDAGLAAHPAPVGVLSPEPEPGPEPIPVPEPAPKWPIMTWLMRGAAAVTCAALITGLATLPSLRTMIVHQHPGSSSGAIDSAVNIAAVIIGIRALAGIGPWLWAARYAARRRRHTGIVTVVALVVSSLGIASSSPQALSTFPVRLLSLVGWLLGLGAVALFWARHVAVAPVGNGGRTPRTVSARKAWTAMVKEAWAASVRKAWPPAFPRQNRKNPGRRRKPPSRAAKRSVLPGGVIGTVVGQRNQPRRSALKPMKAQRVPPTRLTGEETDGTGDARRG